MLFKSGLGQKQGVGGWGRGGMWSGWVGGYVGWVGGGRVGGWGKRVGVGGWVTPLPTHPPLSQGSSPCHLRKVANISARDPCTYSPQVTQPIDKTCTKETRGKYMY